MFRWHCWIITIINRLNIRIFLPVQIVQMTIGYISYEYPPDTAVGGIGTYVYQASQLMKNRGHGVEVFCASFDRTISEYFEGVMVHRLICADYDRLEFNKKVLNIFSERHSIVNFDIIESPEYSADGLSIKKRFPHLPLVVKLHTPHYLIRALSHYYDSLIIKSRFILGGLKKGRLVRPYWRYLRTQDDPDYQIIKLADQIHTPSVSLGDIVSKKWRINRKNVFNVPYPYIPKPSLLSIPPDTMNDTVTYIGRLEVRKGVVELCNVIPLVLKEKPFVRFRFCGTASESPIRGIDMKAYLQKRLSRFVGNIEFLQVQLHEIATVYESTDICVFPSIWENFPNVCLEAMSAARGIVASKEGGMKDMLEKPKAGILVNPLKPKEIAKAILYLLDNPDERKKMGQAARQKLLTDYNQKRIGELMEQHYYNAIKQPVLN